MHTLIVGPRQVGKSTLIRRVVRALDCSVRGFETKKEDALRAEGTDSPIYLYPAGQARKAGEGLAVGRSDGRRPTVFAPAFDRAAALLGPEAQSGDLILMDELGTMESASPTFCAAVLRCLDGETPILAAVKDRDTAFLNTVRNHPNCRCFWITEENREELFGVVLDFVTRQLT